MLIAEIDAVGAQARKHAFDRPFDLLGAAVEFGTTLAALQVNVPTELGGDPALVPSGR